jgi:membrane-associated phospholipid phosphatase
MKSVAEASGAAVRGARPVWWAVAGCAAILAMIALANYTRFPFRDLNFFTFLWTLAALLVVHGTVNAGHYRSLYRSGENLPRVFLHDLSGYLPYLLVAALYDNVSLFESAVRIKVQDLDLILMRMDAMIFGVQPTMALEKYLHPFLVEYFMFAYSLFLLPFLYILYLFMKGDRAAFDTVIMAEVIATTVAIVSFIFLPAKGPRYLFDPANASPGLSLPAYTRPIEGVRIDSLESATGMESLYRIEHDGWNKLERVKTDCMPSVHTALYLICMIAVVRFRKLMKWRRTALVFWIVSGASLVFSCVFLRYHWVVDVMAGAVLASVSFYVAERAVARHREETEPAPGRGQLAAGSV